MAIVFGMRYLDEGWAGATERVQRLSCEVLFKLTGNRRSPRLTSTAHRLTILPSWFMLSAPNITMTMSKAVWTTKISLFSVIALSLLTSELHESDDLRLVSVEHRLHSLPRFRSRTRLVRGPLHPESTYSFVCHFHSLRRSIERAL